MIEHPDTVLAMIFLKVDDVRQQSYRYEMQLPSPVLLTIVHFPLPVLTHQQDTKDPNVLTEVDIGTRGWFINVHMKTTQNLSYGLYANTEECL